MPAAGVSHFAPAPGERSLCRAFPVLGRLPFACSRSPDRALWAGPQPRGQIQLGVEFCRWRVGDGVRRPAGGGPRHPSQIKAPLQERARCYCRRYLPIEEGGRGSPPFCQFSPILFSAGSARIKVRSSRSVRGPAGRAGEEGEQGAAPGCRGPERVDPAPGPSPHTSIPGVRDLRPPWSPISPASDLICMEPLCRAPLLRRRSPAIGTARLQPRSATIRPLP
ncbi:hypothetical protein NDU88_006145 [Pleurodeles waltl]|uniref:Uncharacterized protein n=1 Tax=Pleurodeles waltl TaxID=8319 RepID=A0AAV7X0T5_PLEWA|nr:hypothetical protein NDU88_006145 [Pleurodeles waltl]